MLPTLIVPVLNFVPDLPAATRSCSDAILPSLLTTIASEKTASVETGAKLFTGSNGSDLKSDALTAVPLLTRKSV